jgi:putative ABC transport system permease protein
MADWTRVVRARLKPLGLTFAAESELAEELAQHLDDLYRDLRSGGASHEEAYRTTVSELDDMYPLRVGVDGSQRMAKHEAVPIGDATAGTYMDDFRRDLRYAGRTMWTNPVFVLFVVVTLGLGIGANTTVFTLINTLILNPIPVSDLHELVAVASVETVGTAQSSSLMPISYPNLADYQAQNAVFRSLAGYTGKRILTWQTQGASQGLLSEFVTSNYFSTLGARAGAGRYFLPEDDGPASHASAVLNYGTWQTRFGGNPGIIGTEMRLNNVVVTVIGVAPPGFIGVNGIVGPDVWLPFRMAEQLLPNEMRTAVNDRGKPAFLAVARLNPGVTVAEAQANVTAVAAALAREHPATNEGHTATVRPIGDVMFVGGSTMMRFASAILASVVAIVLLIACSNVANLLLARSAARHQEMAVRVALGASRARLVRQLLTESTCLALLSGGLGLLIGYLSVRLLSRTLPMAGTFVAPKIDLTVLLFTLVVSLVTGFVFGIIPALSASRSSVAEALKEGRPAGRSTRRVTVGHALLVGQVALSFLLLVTAALFLRSIQRAYEIDPGFQTARLAVFVTNPGQAGYGEPQTRAFYREVRERVAGVPGVESVSWASNMPLWARPVSGLEVEGRPQRSRTDSSATIVNTVDRGYFETAGVAIVKGRAFSAVDQSASLPVAIVNEKLAQDYWPGEEAIGKRIRLPESSEMRQIVGIARTANYSAWAEAPQRCVYVPLEQNHLPAMTLYVRSKGDPDQILLSVGREITTAAPQVLMSGSRTGRQIIDGGLFGARIGVALLGVFGLLALGLASMGLYGNLAYAVNQRQREIGLRMALGASQSDVRRLILGQGMWLVLTGVLIGLGAALLVGRLLSRMLYGVGASDPASLAAAGLMLSAIAFLACYLPARWATRVDPIVALREA